MDVEQILSILRTKCLIFQNAMEDARSLYGRGFNFYDYAPLLGKLVKVVLKVGTIVPRWGLAYFLSRIGNSSKSC